MKQSDNGVLDLVARVRAGEDRAMENLLNRYKPLVCGIARRYYLVGGDRDDLVQEGMIGLYKAVMKYDGTRNDNFDAYASMSIARCIQSAVKADRCDKNKPINDGLNFDELDVPAGRTPEEILLEREELAALERAKSLLDADELCILDSYLAGDSYRDIADKVGITTKKVDNELQKIKQKLRTELQ